MSHAVQAASNRQTSCPAIRQRSCRGTDGRQRIFSASVPKIDGNNNTKVLAGDLPSPANPPPGRNFHPRCLQDVDACRREYPVPMQFGTTHVVRCLRAG